MWSFFASFIPKSALGGVFPRVRADEEAEAEDLVDPQQVLRDDCRESDHVKHYLEKYEACNDRVSSRSKTTENCSEELFDYLHALDHCVTKTLFSRLK